MLEAQPSRLELAAWNLFSCSTSSPSSFAPLFFRHLPWPTVTSFYKSILFLALQNGKFFFSISCVKQHACIQCTINTVLSPVLSSSVYRHTVTSILEVATHLETSVYKACHFPRSREFLTVTQVERGTVGMQPPDWLILKLLPFPFSTLSLFSSF